MTEGKRLRQVKSFVKREGRLTPGQQKSLDFLWPKFGIEADGQPIDMQTLFGRHAPVVFEIGFGNGASLIKMAIQQPEYNFIGVEVHRPGVGQLLKAIEENNLTNLRVACTDAVELLKNQIADNVLQRVQLYFPDPWHKKRHHKRRIIQPAFVDVLAQKIRSGGFLHMATDWQDYAEQMLQDLSSSKNFINTSDAGDYIARPDYRPLTKFEQRGHRLGHGVWDLLFQRR
ncbi:tRNA (guanosine(46)-N7)-methyltransferase TrmB [Methylophaga nitratireducenticrescens]|uniref:tRNA (guanine-N(7)-)-methyltransferase n=1 Tax=Methylophaga nitratireducenticrescens TaxID=754476 RepID=I1XKT3_METNJ|nr:tRNA (guanosine(46)-N7)-methyltransferase TrmB [Methylophaga nitratireducenticrescens]AFI85002.1 tRNA (guanosine(46)-N7)-methyltransferase TrmB [Methylophaga nitratireducenticrescens]AUZ85010.1 tRNA (guanosine(46)-N7)-methyltransferase TrmB [Methylophaga nitratireducenticrescens]